jgi:hypothetical protein
MEADFRDKVCDWLEKIDGGICDRKRKLSTTSEIPQLVSPPASLENLAMEETPPRKRRALGFLDPDETPRPRPLCPSSSASDASSATGTPSTRKQLMNLQLSSSGVKYKVLEVDDPPNAATELVNTLEDIGRAHGILPKTFESDIKEKLRDLNLDARKWRYSFTSMEEKDDLPGRIPSFEEVLKVHRKAKECQEYNHEEASWNSQVHLRLLEYIFDDPSSGQCDDYNALSW